MLNRFFSILAGVMSGAIVIMLIEGASHYIYPPPVGLDINNTEAMKEFAASMPVGAFLLVGLAYLSGSFTGGAVSNLICKYKDGRNALSVGAVLMSFGIMNFYMIPHPTWFVILGVLLFIPGAWLGYRTFHKNQINSIN